MNWKPDVSLPPHPSQLIQLPYLFLFLKNTVKVGAKNYEFFRWYCGMTDIFHTVYIEYIYVRYHIEDISHYYALHYVKQDVSLYKIKYYVHDRIAIYHPVQFDRVEQIRRAQFSANMQA